MIRLVAYHEILAARNAELDPHHRRNRAGAVRCALIDADAAGVQPPIEPLQLGDVGANLALGPLGTVDIVEGDFERHLHDLTSAGGRSGGYPRNQRLIGRFVRRVRRRKSNDLRNSARFAAAFVEEFEPRGTLARAIPHLTFIGSDTYMKTASLANGRVNLFQIRMVVQAAVSTVCAEGDQHCRSDQMKHNRARPAPARKRTSRKRNARRTAPRRWPNISPRAVSCASEWNNCAHCGWPRRPPTRRPVDRARRRGASGRKRPSARACRRCGASWPEQQVVVWSD